METREELSKQADALLVDYEQKLKRYEEGDGGIESFEQLVEAQSKYMAAGIAILEKDQITMKAQNEVIQVLAAELSKGATT